MKYSLSNLQGKNKSYSIDKNSCMIIGVSTAGDCNKNSISIEKEPAYLKDMDCNKNRYINI